MELPTASTARRTFSLQRFLLFVGFIAVACGLIRLASVDGYTWLTIPALCCIALAFGWLSGRDVLAFLITFAVAGASYFTTQIHWVGGFPFAAIRMTAVDEQGKPIPNVALSVTRPWSEKPALGYPLSEYQGMPLVSDYKGVIVCRQTRSGVQFGGTRRLLFWCIRICSSSPEFDVNFEHPDHAYVTVPIWKLFEADDYYDQSPPSVTTEIDGRSVEMRVFEQTIVMPPR